MTEKELQEIETRAMENDPEVYGPIVRKLVSEMRCLRNVIYDSEVTLGLVAGLSDDSEQRIKKVRGWLKDVKRDYPLR